MKTQNASKWKIRYDNEPPTPPPADPPATPPPADKKTFTQEEVNAILAKEKREAQSKLDQYHREIEALTSKSTLTAAEKTELESRIETLNNSLKTKEQIAEEEKTKLSKTLTTEKEKAAEEAKRWKTKYTEDRIANELTSAAVANKAKNPKQIIALMRPDTFIQERIADGKPTGEFEVLVKMSVTGEDGKSTLIELPASKAIERMAQNEEHFNLFEGTGASGLGAKTGAGPTDFKSMLGSMESYQANRAKILES